MLPGATHRWPVLAMSFMSGMQLIWMDELYAGSVLLRDDSTGLP